MTGTSRLLVALSAAALVLVGCSNPEEVPRASVRSITPDTTYIVPEGGHQETGYDPKTETVEDVFTAEEGYFIATNPNVGGAPRLTGVIPVGWGTLSVTKPPKGTVGAFGYMSGLTEDEYVPNAMVGMWTTDETPDKVYAETMSEYGPSDARWDLVREGADSRGVRTDLYQGEWTSRGQPIRGFGYLAAVPHNGLTYVFTVIISQSMMVATDSYRWDMQSNILLNSIEVTEGTD